MKVISWNLLRKIGATLDDVVELIERERPDLLLMQEVTHPFSTLRERVGGSYAWEPQPGRIHGLAVWSAAPLQHAPTISALRPGAWVQRICQVVTVGDIGIANVHLSHGQRLNRRQLREVAQRLPVRAAVVGDFNLVGPAMLPGFHDVGPRRPTHRMGDIVPLRIDRCLARGLVCADASVLPRRGSDHRPICMHLSAEAGEAAAMPALRYRGAAGVSPRRAIGWAGSAR